MPLCVQSAEELVLRDFNYCVIDEVDSILIDEARTPLIISGPAEKSSERYMQAAQLADALERDFHYTVDEKQKSILITEEGYEAAEDVLQVAFPTSCRCKRQHKKLWQWLKACCSP